GTGFSSVPAQNALSFNGTAATVSASTPTQLTATVPAGATTGPLSVTTPSGSATSAQAFVVTSNAPTITGFSPAVGIAGSSVTISGTNFETVAANDRVTFNSRFAAISSASTTGLSVVVPSFASSGRIAVATPNGFAVSATDFFIPPGSYAASSVSV